MRAIELIIVAVVHVLGIAVAALVMAAVNKGEPTLASVVAAVLGSETAAYLYHRRQPDPAPFVVKAVTGFVMAVFCVVESMVAQYRWNWLTYPEVTIPIAAVGTFVFPFVLFGTMQQALAKSKQTAKKP